MSQVYDYAILGAGLAGVLASFELSRLSSTLALFEKGRGVGGRLSRFGKYNLGPDFIPRHRLTDKVFRGDKASHSYYHDSPINTLLKNSLEQTPGLDTFFSTKIVSATFDKGLWILLDEYGNKVESRWLISSLPQPQAIQLFQDYDITFNNVTYVNAVTVITKELSSKLLSQSYCVTQFENKYKIIVKDICPTLFDNESREKSFNDFFEVNPDRVHFWRYGFCQCDRQMENQVYFPLQLGFIGDWLKPGNNLWNSIQSVEDMIAEIKVQA